MTVLAYRNGVLASDSQVTSSDIKVGTCKKITKTKDGWLAGATGGISSVSQFLEWAETRDLETFIKLDETFTGLLINPNGEVNVVEEDLHPFKIEAEFFAEGHGRDVALGAMAMGASAEKAVHVAITFCDGCGGDIQMVKL